MMRDITPQFFGALALVVGAVTAHGLWVQLSGTLAPTILPPWAQAWLVPL